MAKPLWLISYDVSCPKRLRSVYRYCAAHGWALQKSVFVFSGQLKEKETICQTLLELIDQENDRLLCLPFIPSENSFHIGKRDEWLIVHSDTRLEDYIL
ncbi:CRISPR-associated endonuclease Cas2 [Vibrio sp. 10N.222.51.C8]|uniref:CRISPR-associated endonuclease Cas2 n=1 Tax=unclassified Vibrio TaxID=2614977 RepID=UPI000C82D4CA|nr:MULTISPECIES: CRISPR-associated endonuclease Cas2 [unclassified Vibrio]PMO01657.1 CRISPR-associated endonuclease Cas2 [Vibrio sp. 10N.222.55.C12]PMO02819.1 CRISPR-associated endonuclease Cas2 [Vibrio sp. 10N.222.55.F9]PMO13580.1 CRISPR-associated endonuclease Cas2 [Vibrio sp. 10N.222.54.F10]PMO14653.1 CRISPR-associated endonuclease Cas2 [Vibrio sp. 10N.222.54.B6]TKF38520.1 CRISPR-associated endonuclease Cas2 [Vibrio sp. F13]